MHKILYPLVFKPIYKDYLWGGNQIIERYQRDEAAGIYAESWEITDRPEGVSVVSNGPLAGCTLHELMQSSSIAVCGSNEQRFPLLIKLIDSKQRLSLQVHPSADNAEQLDGEAKNEMWYVLAADDDAAIFCGYDSSASRDDLVHGLTGNAEHLIRRIAVQPGDIINIPGGCLHAIDAGCLLLEVQQNSDTTYRLNDWGRVDAKGRPRQLHIEKGIQAINWENDGSTALIRPQKDLNTFKRTLLKTDFFSIESWTITQQCNLDQKNGFQAFFIEEGQLTLAYGTDQLRLKAGQSFLIPASCVPTKITPTSSSVQLIRSTL